MCVSLLPSCWFSQNVQEFIYKLLQGTGKDDASTIVHFVERGICALPKQPLPLPLTKAEFQWLDVQLCEQGVYLLCS